MAFEIVTIPCLADNYSFLLHSNETGETALIDVPEAAPISNVLRDRGWSLTEVWITHHHWDHVDGLGDLEEAKHARIVGSAADADRLPPLNLGVGESDTFMFGGAKVDVLDVSGHTINHLAFYVETAKAVFTADSLMAMGCGRLFEGSAHQMWESLSKLARLPDDTTVFSGHEYTSANTEFALSVDPENPDLIKRAKEISAMRADNIATVPSPLGLERATNPFLRASNGDMKRGLGMAHASDADVFAELRKRKDNF